MLTIANLLAAYRSGAMNAAHVVDGVFARIDAEGVRPIWISLADRDEAVARASRIDPMNALREE